MTECLPGDTLVNGANITAAYRRWYRGPLVKVITDTGREFTGTPNHPMLTLRGWVALGNLTKEDSLLGYVCDVEPRLASFSGAGNIDVEAPPATIAEIFDSLAAVGVLERRRTGKPDFHGDGLNGHVDVLRPNGILRFGRFAEVTKSLVNGVLSQPMRLPS